jgi:hypothetical protein
MFSPFISVIAAAFLAAVLASIGVNLISTLKGHNHPTAAGKTGGDGGREAIQ